MSIDSNNSKTNKMTDSSKSNRKGKSKSQGKGKGKSKKQNNTKSQTKIASMAKARSRITLWNEVNDSIHLIDEHPSAFPLLSRFPYITRISGYFIIIRGSSICDLDGYHLSLHYADKNGRAGGSHFCANHSHKGNATWQIDIGFDHDPVLDKRVITWDTSRTPFGMYWHKKRKCLLEMQDDISAEITATIMELNNMIEYRRNSCKFVYSIFKIACKNVTSTINDGAS